jgi:hypothetical protein
MAGGSKGGQAQKNWSTSTGGQDAGTEDMRRKVYEAAQAAAANGPGANVNGASDYYAQMMNAGKTGTDALGGNAAAVQTLMNPYQQQVIDQINQQWGKTGQQAQMAVNDGATRAGAFGGTRQGVASGVAAANNAQAQNQQVGGLMYGGFNDAMVRAAALAQGGAGAAGANANLGMQGVGNPDLWRLLMLKGGLAGTPYGTTSGTTSTGVGANAGFQWGTAALPGGR